MHIAYIRQEPGRKARPLTRKERILQLVERLGLKWRLRDIANADRDLERIEADIAKASNK